MASITLDNVGKVYPGDTRAVGDVSIDIADGEFIVLVGPSGCGKSTLLRMVAGLESITDGEIRIGDRVVNRIEPADRDIAMVFQNYAIYPHMSVRKNIGFGLRSSKLPKAQKETRIEEVAELLGMTDYLARKPAALSGGQRQRVAIGRAMVRDPAVFLFDEPLSNLDAQLRTQMRLEIKKLHQRVGSTIVFVTHDQVEAMTMADRIVIMKDGHIQQIGAPADVYHHPANTFVAQFIGAPAMNLLPGRIIAGELMLDTGQKLSVPASSDGEVHLGIRPEDLRPAQQDEVQMRGKISVAEPLGAGTLLYVDIGGTEVIATGPGRNAPGPGETIGLTYDAQAIHIFDAATGSAIP